MDESPALTFALTLKRWFRANGWPQKITDDWAKDPGIKSENGPWASQLCNAMKGDKYNPRAEFYIALGAFNDFVAKKDLKRIQNLKLRDRFVEATPMLADSGEPYGAAEFWSLYAGLIVPPEFEAASTIMTQEEIDEWTRLIRLDFKNISLKHMCSRGEAWEMLKDAVLAVHRASDNFNLMPDDMDWIQEVLSGIRDPTLEEGIRMAQRWQGSRPLETAMSQLLKGKKLQPIV